MKHLVGAIALGLLAGSTAFADWPQFLGPTRNGVSTEQPIIAEIPERGAPVRWRIEVGDGYSGPIVAGSKVFLFHQPDAEETLECFDALTGKSIWRVGYPCDYRGGYGTGPGPRATPASDGESIYTFGAKGMLQAVDQMTGEVRWRRDLRKEFVVPEGYFGIGPSPIVDQGKLLVMVGGKKAALAAFDGKTGESRWTSANDEASYASPVIADLAGRRTALFFARTGLHLVDPATGEVRDFFRWRARMDASVNASTPVVVDGKVFLSAQYGVGTVLLASSDGKLQPVWRMNDGLVCHYDTPVPHEGHLYGIDGRQEGGARLCCMRVADGEVRWAEDGFGCAGMIRVGTSMIATTEAGEVVLFDATPDAFRPAGRMAFGQGECRAPGAFSEGVLYVRSPRELVAIDFRPSN